MRVICVCLVQKLINSNKNDIFLTHVWFSANWQQRPSKRLPELERYSIHPDCNQRSEIHLQDQKWVSATLCQLRSLIPLHKYTLYGILFLPMRLRRRTQRKRWWWERWSSRTGGLAQSRQRLDQPSTVIDFANSMTPSSHFSLYSSGLKRWWHCKEMWGVEQFDASLKSKAH